MHFKEKKIDLRRKEASKYRNTGWVRYVVKSDTKVVADRKDRLRDG